VIEVSIALIVKNEAKCIKNCIESLLDQTFSNFEIIIIDNDSKDNTIEIINSFKDRRIKIHSSTNLSCYSNLRNFSLEKTKGNYIFFTDGDCNVHPDWIKEGLKHIKDNSFDGVEGRTFYESKSSISVSDYFTYRTTAGGYMTCNVAYKKDSLIKVKGFDPKFNYIYEDRDLGMRIKKNGKIKFEPNMLVFHQQKKLSIKNLFYRSKRAGDMIYFDKKHGRDASEYIKYNIVYPNHLIIIIFPPIILLGSRIENISDIIFVFIKYFSFIYERLIIWKNSFKYKRFLL